MCDCVTKTNEDLKQYNALLVTNLFGQPRTTVGLCKREEKKRGKPPILQATYCPFCGEKYT